ncbi:MAG: response regulator [Planctomycetota bacterium]
MLTAAPKISVHAPAHPYVVIADDNPDATEIVTRLLSPLGYEVQSVGSGREVLDLIEGRTPDLVLLDINMPAPDGLSVCRELRARAETKSVPVVIVSAYDDDQHRLEGIQAGADAYLTKPFPAEILTAKIENLLVRKNLHDSLENPESVLLTLVRAIEAKSPYTQGHSMRVATYSQRVGQHLELPEVKCQDLYIGGILHDIGKIGVHEDIINKPGPLDRSEFDEMKKHPALGYEIILPLKITKPALHIVRSHHEKLDGSGYPDGLKADEIELETRIVAIADAFDALTTDRPYRKRMTRREAIDLLDAEADMGVWDRDVIRAFDEALVKTREQR